MKTRLSGCILVLRLVGCSGCASRPTPKKPPSSMERGENGRSTRDNRVCPAAAVWRLVEVESGGEFGFGFLKTDPGSFPSQSMFVYDENDFWLRVQL